MLHVSQKLKEYILDLLCMMHDEKQAFTFKHYKIIWTVYEILIGHQHVKSVYAFCIFAYFLQCCVVLRSASFIFYCMGVIKCFVFEQMIDYYYIIKCLQEILQNVYNVVLLQTKQLKYDMK